ncbi:hypothetical protein SCHPADRAFT_226701 [Schizopora paradoxa]|uniref:Transmembrane protein n=1 Tax=Schizopora paradoxa TaxID=27342 RepID=A0A0H2SGM2_9AGAM|nr:hypothetical protein SCHPADRAFT_226701 [Schizopora paradoxa]
MSMCVPNPYFYGQILFSTNNFNFVHRDGPEEEPGGIGGGFSVENFRVLSVYRQYCRTDDCGIEQNSQSDEDSHTSNSETPCTRSVADTSQDSHGGGRFEIRKIMHWNDIFSMLVLTLAAICGSGIFSWIIQYAGTQETQIFIVMMEMAAITSILGFVLYVRTSAKEFQPSTMSRGRTLNVCMGFLVPTVFYSLSLILFLVPMVLMVFATVDRVVGFVSLGLAGFFLCFFFGGWFYISSLEKSRCDDLVVVSEKA